MKRSPGSCERLAQALERAWGLIVSGHVTQERGQLVESGAVHAAAVFLLHAVPRTGAQLLDGPRLPRDPHDGSVEATLLHHLVERRKHHLVREVSRRAEEHERIGAQCRDS